MCFILFDVKQSPNIEAFTKYLIKKDDFSVFVQNDNLSTNSTLGVEIMYLLVVQTTFFKFEQCFIPFEHILYLYYLPQRLKKISKCADPELMRLIPSHYCRNVLKSQTRFGFLSKDIFTKTTTVSVLGSFGGNYLLSICFKGNCREQYILSYSQTLLTKWQKRFLLLTVLRRHLTFLDEIILVNKNTNKKRNIK